MKKNRLWILWLVFGPLFFIEGLIYSKLFVSILLVGLAAGFILFYFVLKRVKKRYFLFLSLFTIAGVFPFIFHFPRCMVGMTHIILGSGLTLGGIYHLICGKRNLFQSE